MYRHENGHDIITLVHVLSIPSIFPAQFWFFSSPKNEGQAGLGKMKLMRGYIGFQNIDWTVTESKL